MHETDPVWLSVTKPSEHTKQPSFPRACGAYFPAVHFSQLNFVAYSPALQSSQVVRSEELSAESRHSAHSEDPVTFANFPAGQS